MYVINGNRKKRLIFDGNSLVARAGSLANGQYIGTTLYNSLTGAKPAYFNYAVAGRNTTQLISDFPTKVAPYIAPGDILVFWELTNDIKQNGLTAQQAYDNLVTYCGLAKAKGAIVITMSMISRNQNGTEGSGIETTRLAVNALLNADHSFCDYYFDAGGLSQFDSQADTANTTYYESDQLHLTNAGYQLIVDNLLPIVQPLI